MSFISLVPLFASITLISFLVYILSTHRTDKSGISYTLFLLSCILFTFTDFIIWNLPDEKLATVFLRILSPFWMTCSFSYLFFMYTFIRKKIDLPFIIFGIIIACFIFAGLYTDLVVAGAVKRTWGWVLRDGPLYYHALVATLIAPGLYSIFVVAVNFKKIPLYSRIPAFIAILGILITFLTGIWVNVMLIMQKGMSDLPSFGSSLTVIQGLFVFMAILKKDFLAPDLTQISEGLFSNSSDGILIMNRFGRFIDANSKALEIFNLSKEEIQDVNSNHVLNSLFAVPLSRYQSEHTFSCDDKERTISIKQHPFLNNGHIVGTLLIIQDITEIREAQRREATLNRQIEFCHYEKLASLGQLAGGVAHDFKNILNGAIGLTDILLLEGDYFKEEHRGYLQNLNNLMLNALSLTRNMLSFSRKSTGTKKKFNLVESGNNLISILYHTIPKNITIKFNYSDKQIDIYGDRAQIENMIMNMAINARDAMPEGGILGIDVDQNYDSTGNCLVNLRISDTGCGMDEATAERIFEPFFTTKSDQKGTGLGLANVKEIVDDHSATISVSSRPSEGTVFLISFPCEMTFTELRSTL